MTPRPAAAAQRRDRVGDRVDAGQVGHRAGRAAPAVDLHELLRDRRLLLDLGGPDVRQVEVAPAAGHGGEGVAETPFIG